MVDSPAQNRREHLRAKIRLLFEQYHAGLTSYEIADFLGESFPVIQREIAALRAKGWLKKTVFERPNKSKVNSAVWQKCNAEQRMHSGQITWSKLHIREVDIDNDLDNPEEVQYSKQEKSKTLWNSMRRIITSTRLFRRAG